jgi:hypothetical protein
MPKDSLMNKVMNIQAHKSGTEMGRREKKTI